MSQPEQTAVAVKAEVIGCDSYRYQQGEYRREKYNRAIRTCLFAWQLFLVIAAVHGAEIVIPIIGSRATPESVSITAGDSVTWLAVGESNVQVVESFTGEFKSPFLDKSAPSYSFTFKQPGTIAYRHRSYFGTPPYSAVAQAPVYGGIIQVLPVTGDQSAITINSPLGGSYFGRTSPDSSYFVSGGNQTYIAILATSTNRPSEINHVEFFAGSNFLGVTTNAPFWFTWTNAPLGTNLLTAKEIDLNGSLYVSRPVSIMVEQAQSPRLRNARSLPGGVFAYDYTLPAQPVGLGYVVHRSFDLKDSYGEERQRLVEGFGTVLNEIDTNRFQFFWVRARY